MTHRDDSDDEDLSILLVEYEQVANRDSVLFQTLFATVGIGATVLGAILLAVPTYEPGASGLAGSEWAYLAVPLPSTILLGLVVFLTLHIALTGQYAHGLEDRIAQISRERISPETLGIPAGYPARPTPSFLRILGALFNSRFTRRTWFYSVSLIITVACVGGLLLATPLIGIATATPRVKWVALGIYGVLDLVIGLVYFRTLQPGHKVLADAIGDLEGLPPARSKGTSKFVRYLILSVRSDQFSKLLVGTIGILLGRIAIAGPLGDVTWDGVGREIVLFVVVFEFFFYQARYQWNDLRDAEEDALHPSSVVRGRIPPPVTLARKVVVGVSIPTRTALGVVAAVVFGGGSTAYLLWGLLAMWLFAIAYERARDFVRWNHPDPRSAGWMRQAVLIYVLVGSGYALRIGVGLFIGSGGQIDPAVAVLLMATMWLVEAATVPMAWVLDAASNFLWGQIGDPDRTSFTQRLRAKAHIGPLLRQAGLLSSNSAEREQPATAEATTRSAEAETNDKGVRPNEQRYLLKFAGPSLWTVWAIAGAVMATLGGAAMMAVGDGLGQVGVAHSAVGVVLGGLVGGLILAQGRLPVGLTVVTALAGSIPLVLATHLSRPWLAVTVFVGLIGFYEFTRCGTYLDMTAWHLRLAGAVISVVEVPARACGRFVRWLAGSPPDREVNRPGSGDCSTP